jgi:hypothetical protein
MKEKLDCLHTGKENENISSNLRDKPIDVISQSLDF